MRLLIVDSECQALDLAMRAGDVGHEVRWFRYCPGHDLKSGLGMKQFKIIDDWRSSLEWVKDGGFILTTGNFRFLHELDRCREMGIKVFGPTVQSAKLEIDRGAGMEAMRAVGIDLPEYHEFASLEECYRFARKQDRPFVFKPLGDESDKSLTYVADDPADLVGWLERQIKGGKQLKGKCILQEKIDAICEIGVSGWMGKDGFLEHKWQTCIEHKKLMDGEIGPATGEQGTICQYVEDDMLAGEMLLPMEPILRSLGHRGDFSIGAIVDKKGKTWPLEFTSRCGWPAFHIQVASHRGDPIKWMNDLLDGKDSLKVSYDTAIGVVISQPRYPYENSPENLVLGNPIRGIENPPPGTDIHLVSAMIDRGPEMKDGKIVYGPQYQTTGEYVAVATALGKGITKARDKVYGFIDQIKLSDKIYRTDIGEKVIKALPKLHEFGYLVQMRP